MPVVSRADVRAVSAARHGPARRHRHQGTHQRPHHPARPGRQHRRHRPLLRLARQRPGETPRHAPQHRGRLGGRIPGRVEADHPRPRRSSWCGWTPTQQTRPRDVNFPLLIDYVMFLLRTSPNEAQWLDPETGLVSHMINLGEVMSYDFVPPRTLEPQTPARYDARITLQPARIVPELNHFRKGTCGPLPLPRLQHADLPGRTSTTRPTRRSWHCPASPTTCGRRGPGTCPSRPLTACGATCRTSRWRCSRPSPCPRRSRRRLLS